METNYQLISYMQNLDDANLEYTTIDEAVKKFNNMKYDDFIEYVNKNVKGIKPKFIFTFNRRFQYKIRNSFIMSALTKSFK
jgi:hypothetical protein